MTTTVVSGTTINMEERVSQYVQLRDWLDARQDQLDEELKPYKAIKKALEAMFVEFLQATNQTSARTNAGTAHLLEKTSAKVEDPAVFRQFIIDNDLWDLVDMKANAPSVTEYIEQHQGALPPGLTYSKYITAGVRRS